MASISNDPNGRRRILFIDTSGQRKAIRLGKVPLRYAEAVKVKVEDLVFAAKHYLQMTDEYFDRAVAGRGSSDTPCLVQKLPGAAQKPHEGTGNHQKREDGQATQGSNTSRDADDILVTSCNCKTYRIPPRGVEPLFSD